MTLADLHPLISFGALEMHECGAGHRARKFLVPIRWLACFACAPQALPIAGFVM